MQFSFEHLVVLDYVKNYPKKIRTEAQGILAMPELNELVSKGFVKQGAVTDYSGFHYADFTIDEQQLQLVDEALRKGFYPTFSSTSVESSIQNLYQQFPDECHLAYSRLQQGGFVSDWSLENSSSWQKFLRRMSQLALGYLVKYSTSNRDSRSSFSEFHFRTTPMDVGSAFCEKIESTLEMMSEADAWVLYVSDALSSNDPNLVKRNRSDLSIPEIDSAWKKFVSKGYSPTALRIASSRVKERIRGIFSFLCARDMGFFPNLCTMLTMASRQDGKQILAQSRMAKLVELKRDLQFYIDELKQKGIGLVSSDGDLVFPGLVKEILEERLSGIYSRTILVDNQKTALEALEEILHDQAEIDVMDSYLSYATVDRICRYAPENAHIRILSSILVDYYSNEDTGMLQSDIIEFRRRNREIKCRVLWYPSDGTHAELRPFFHDRYIFLQGTAWQLGASINHLGNKLTSISELRRDWRDKLHTVFRYCWNTRDRFLCEIYPGLRVIDVARNH